MAEKDQTKQAIPPEYVERVALINDQDNMIDIRLEISKRRYSDAIAKYDADAAFAARTEGTALVLESKAIHRKLWDTIHEALPDTLVGCWTLNSNEMTVKKTGTSPASAGLGNILGALAVGKVEIDIDTDEP